MVKGLVMVVLAAALAGCARSSTPLQRIDRPNTTQAEYEADARVCAYDVEKAAATATIAGGSGGGLLDAAQNRHTQWRLFASCMQARGYTVQYKPGCEPSGPYVTLGDLGC